MLVRMIFIFLTAFSYARQSVLPHLPTDGSQFNWRLKCINSDSREQAVRLEFHKSDGSLCDAVNFVLLPNEILLLDTSKFNTSPSWVLVLADQTVTARVEIASRQSPTDWVVFESIDHTNDMLHWFLGDSSKQWDGIALVNLGWQSGEVNVSLFNSTSQLLANTKFALSSNEKKKFTIKDLFPESYSKLDKSEIDGRVLITSSQPLAGLAIRGNFADASVRSNPLVDAAPFPVIQSYSLMGSDNYPTCVAFDSTSQDLYISAYFDGSIQRLNKQGSTWLIEPNSSEWDRIRIMRMDSKNQRLWIYIEKDYISPEQYPFSLELVVYDIKHKSVLKRITFDGDSIPLNFVLDREGNAFAVGFHKFFNKKSYIEIRKYPASLENYEILATYPNPYGRSGTWAAITEDQRYLIVYDEAVLSGSLTRISIATGLATTITDTNGSTHFDLDPMEFLNSAVLLNYSRYSPRMFKFQDDYLMVHELPIPDDIASFLPSTHTAVTGNGSFWIIDSQSLSYVWPEEYPLVLPFKLYSIPIERILRDIPQ